jgi:leucyl/phenylalanyl-tRNA--protein transferase
MVLEIPNFRVSHSLVKKLRGLDREPDSLHIRCDTAFEEVMHACAAPRDGQHGTWITPLIIDAYVSLHEMGLAHSVETYQGDQLVGGLYGVSLGKMFFGESMFARQTDASKLALACLVFWLREQGFPMIDCQQQTSHLASLGARPIQRDIFAERISRLVDLPPPGPWPERLGWLP